MQAIGTAVTPVFVIGVSNRARSLMQEINFSIEVKELLESCGLPVVDIPGNDQIQFFGIKTDGALSAVVGIEVYGEYALVRSLAVKQQFRGRGIGRDLIASLEDWARRKLVTRLFLLTETAGRFFGYQGYRPIPRSETPQVIEGTSEFSGICPGSAELMTKELIASNEFNSDRDKADAS